MAVVNASSAPAAFSNPSSSLPAMPGSHRVNAEARCARPTAKMKRQNSVTSANSPGLLSPRFLLMYSRAAGMIRNDAPMTPSETAWSRTRPDDTASDGGRDPSAPNDSQDVIVSINQRVAALTSNGRRQVNRPPVSFLTTANAHSSHARNFPKANWARRSLHMRADVLPSTPDAGRGTLAAGSRYPAVRGHANYHPRPSPAALEPDARNRPPPVAGVSCWRVGIGTNALEGHAVGS